MILVTGSEGFIGKRVVRALLEEHHEVIAIDRADPQHPRDLCEMPKHLRVDAVVHLAAHADVSANWESDAERAALYRDNITATITLMEAVHCTGPIVFASTATVYGDSPGRPSMETDVPVATSPYAASKLAGEALLQAYAHHSGVPLYCLRLAAAVGHGYSHGHVVDFVRMAKLGVIAARTAGNVRRSVVHVADVADLIAQLVLGRDPAGIYNVASGQWSWRDTVDVMREVRPRAPLVVHAPDPQVERGWVGDNLVSISNEKLLSIYHPRRSIRHGVVEALHDLGWRVGETAAVVPGVIEP
jgi:UDP-glucose 4-epimerase